MKLLYLFLKNKLIRYQKNYIKKIFLIKNNFKCKIFIYSVKNKYVKF